MNDSRISPNAVRFEEGKTMVGENSGWKRGWRTDP